MRNLALAFLSIGVTASVIGHAYYQKKQFYPSVVYITKSNPSMAVIYIEAFILVLLTGKLMKKVFFGDLRAAELEHLMERAWYALTETCLAFTVFRDDFSPKFVALFTVLLFLKSFHWLAEDRVDFMERSSIISWLFHIRVVALMILLGSLDLNMLEHAYHSTVTQGASVQLVFGFEYALLITVIINIAIKYALHTLALNSDSPWENKAIFLLYTELIMGFFKVILYIAFMAIMVRISMLPLFAFRPMYYTMRAFKKAFNDVILSRRAIRNMNTLYPDATPEELASADNVCIICREEMVTASKKLPCNHIFHKACLRSWFQRQQTCPTCRLNILRTPPPTPTRAQPQEAPRPFQPPPFPFGWPNVPQQPTTQGGSGQQPTGSPSEATGGPPPPPTNLPFFCPPFPFLPFNLPPPVDISQLTPEQLAEMEEATRAGVEARLQCLRNIQLLLDASVVLMQQYSASAAVAHAASRVPVSTTPSPTADTAGPSSGVATEAAPSSPTTGTPDPVASTSSSVSTPVRVQVSTPPSPTADIAGHSSGVATETGPRSPSTGTPTHVDSTSSSVSTPVAAAEAPGASKGPTPPTTGGPHSPELEEARRRRLAKFNQAVTD